MIVKIENEITVIINMYSSITSLEDYSLDNNFRPYLYQTHAGELNCASLTDYSEQFYLCSYNVF